MIPSDSQCQHLPFVKNFSSELVRRYINASHTRVNSDPEILTCKQVFFTLVHRHIIFALTL